RLLPNRGGNFGAPVSQGGFSGVEIDLREADIRLDASAEDGDVHVDPDIEIVALEMIEKLEVIVEFAQNAVDADELDGGEISALLAGQAELLGADVGLGQLQLCIALQSHGDEIGAFLFRFAGQVFGGDFEALILLEPELCPQEDFEFVFTAFKLNGALPDAGFGELRFGHFDGQLESFGLAFLSDLQNPGGAFLLFGKKLKRVAHLGQLEVGHGGA